MKIWLFLEEKLLGASETDDVESGINHSASSAPSGHLLPQGEGFLPPSHIFLAKWDIMLYNIVYGLWQGCTNRGASGAL